MTSPRVSAIARTRIGRSFAGAGLAVMIATLVFAPAGADDQQDPYSATVKVDATADSAAAARTIARTEGERRALNDVVQQLSGSTDLSKLPKLDDQAITDMVASFEVANEKMSTVRYLADYTFHFRAAKIRQLMHTAGIAVAGTETNDTAASGAAASAESRKPLVIIPVYQNGDELALWDDPNPWRDAWGQVPPASGPAKLVLPLGGVGDLTAIDAEQARSGDTQALTEIAQHNGADEALVAVAAARQQAGRLTGIDVTVKRYRSGQLMDSRSDSIDANLGESDSDLFKRAVTVVSADIEHGGPAASDREASLSAVIPISSLGDWIALRRKLSAVPVIHAVDLLSLSRHQAKVVIKFVGKPDQLKSSLAEANLDLAGADPDWRLVPAGAASP